MNRRTLTLALSLAVAHCGASARTGPTEDRCPVTIDRVVAEGALPDDLDQIERAWAVKLFDASGGCHRVTFTPPVRGELGNCGARATLTSCGDPTRPIARYALVMNTCPTRRSCDEMVPATLEGTYGQEPAACREREPSQLTPDGSRLTVGTEGAVIVVRAPDRAQGSLPFDTMVLRVGGRLAASAELGHACRAETTQLAISE
jgi:hypothetical protein